MPEERHVGLLLLESDWEIIYRVLEIRLLPEAEVVHTIIGNMLSKLHAGDQKQ